MDDRSKAETPTEWATLAARRILEKFDDEASVDTAHYRDCNFILASARIALRNKDFAAQIGAIMEPRRAEDQDFIPRPFPTG